jgi:acetyl-CoA synthetase
LDALLPTWSFGLPLLAYGGRFDPEKAYWLIGKYAVRNTFLFPTALKMMMKAVPKPRDKYGPELNLRTVMSGGEAVGDAVMNWAKEELGVTINEILGQTEINYVVGGCAAIYPPKPGAIGLPYPGHRVALLDDQGQPLPTGEVGEICVQRSCNGEADPVFLLEYWKQPEATRDKYFGTGDEAWGRTGDLAKCDEEGYLWYQGRADDMLKRAGYRIGPGEIENCLVKHPAVANAAVIGAADALRGTIVKAFVVLQPGNTPGSALEAELQQHVRQYLAPYEYPKVIEFIDALPMTTTGKVQRRLLRLRDAEHNGSEFTPMTTPAPDERRQQLQLREVFENAYMLIEPFFDPSNQWGGKTLEHLAFRVMREHFPQVSSDEIYLFIEAAKRVYAERQESSR